METQRALIWMKGQRHAQLAAIGAADCEHELGEMQDRAVELVLERCRLGDMRDAIDAEILEQKNAVDEECQGRVLVVMRHHQPPSLVWS